MSIRTTFGVFTVNSVQFFPLKIPVLLQILSGAQDANDLLPEGAVYLLPMNSTIKIPMAGRDKSHHVSSTMLSDSLTLAPVPFAWCKFWFKPY